MIEIVLFTVKKKLLLNCEEITKTSRKYVYTFFIEEKSSEKHTTLILFAFSIFVLFYFLF